MGFVYKLTPQICTFIIDQKRAQPKLSCQAISGLILSTYGQQVSKSSVHELLKQSQVIIPRARKTKEKFEIPQHKKEQISKALASFAIMGGQRTIQVIQETPKTVMIKEPAVPRKIEEAIKEEPVVVKQTPMPRCGEIFIKAALYDLSLKPILGIKEFSDILKVNDPKNKAEWAYLNQQALVIKIENQQGDIFYIDPRFQLLSSQHPSTIMYSAPIERAVCEAADYIVNNIKPLLINKIDVNVSKEMIHNFIGMMNNSPGKGIKAVFLLGEDNKVLAEFKYLLMHPRQFTVEIDSKHIDIKELAEIKDLKITPSVSKENGIFIISNLKQKSYEETNHDISKRFLNIPVPGLMEKKIFQEEKFDLIASLKNRAQGLFFPNTSKELFEQILCIEGYEQEDKSITLKVDQADIFVNELQNAVDIFNALHICDFKGQKLTLRIVINSV